MGVGRRFNVKARSRPKKGAKERKRRVKTHVKRLAALGIPAEKTAKMTPTQLRRALAVAKAK